MQKNRFVKTKQGNNLNRTAQFTQHFPDLPIPVILDANWVNSLAIIRGLGNVGIKSIAINHNKWGVGLFSKYSTGMVAPNPWDDPEGLIEFLITIGKNISQKGILFVSDDKYLETISKARKSLESYFHFTFPEYSIIKILLEKQNQYAAAEKLGIKYPRSKIINSSKDLKDWSSDSYPVIVKGASGKEFWHTFGRQAIEIDNQQDLLKIVDQKQGFDILIQELIPGGEENLFTVGCYINQKGIAKGVFTGRKLRQYPRYYGTCTVGESVPCQELVDPSLELLRNLNFFGISQVEFKKDPRDGSYKLIEINGRFWKWHGLSTICGINLAAAAYYDIIGSDKYQPSPQKYGIKWLLLPEELLGVGQDLRSGKFHFIKWLETISPPFRFGLFDFRDMRPWVMMVISKMGKLLKIIKQ